MTQVETLHDPKGEFLLGKALTMLRFQLLLDWRLRYGTAKRMISYFIYFESPLPKHTSGTGLYWKSGRIMATDQSYPNDRIPTNHGGGCIFSPLCQEIDMSCPNLTTRGHCKNKMGLKLYGGSAREIGSHITVDCQGWQPPSRILVLIPHLGGRTAGGVSLPSVPSSKSNEYGSHPTLPPAPALSTRSETTPDSLPVETLLDGFVHPGNGEAFPGEGERYIFGVGGTGKREDNHFKEEAR